MAEQSFEGALRERGLRVTGERRAVFEALARAQRPLRRSELVVAAEAASVGVATTYRAVATFVEAGIVQPVEVAGEIAYELLPPYASHHHHFHCVSCGTVSEVTVERCAQLVIDDPPGDVLYHQVEAYGVCHRCLNERPRGTSQAR